MKTQLINPNETIRKVVRWILYPTLYKYVYLKMQMLNIALYTMFKNKTTSKESQNRANLEPR